MNNQLSDRMCLLIALKRLDNDVVVTAEDLEWLKGKNNIEVVFNGGHLEGTTFGLFKPIEWPPSSKSRN